MSAVTLHIFYIAKVTLYLHYVYIHAYFTLDLVQVVRVYLLI